MSHLQKYTCKNQSLHGSLEPDFAGGKVVVCDRGVNPRVEKGAVVRDAGGVGMILANTVASWEQRMFFFFFLPRFFLFSFNSKKKKKKKEEEEEEEVSETASFY